MKFIRHNRARSYALVLALLFGACATNTVFAETGITLNLKDADLQSFIETVAEITGKNFVIDPRVKAKVTVISARPMDRKEIYEQYCQYMLTQLAQGIKLTGMSRHIIGLFQGQPGARKFRQYISAGHPEIDQNSPEILEAAIKSISSVS